MMHKNTMQTSEVRRAYYGSDANLTIALMGRLLACDCDGRLATLLFKAQKASTRAKKYRGGRDGRSFRSMAYERKQESLNLLAGFLEDIGAESWGWGRDEITPVYSWVLYVDLPNGQVSFHSAKRGPGRDYEGKWDRIGMSEDRVIAFCESVLELNQ